MEVFTEKEKEMLSMFCTSVDSDRFVLFNLPEAVKGALFSRYSRSQKSLRRLLLDEFIQGQEGISDLLAHSPKNSAGQQIVATKKAEEFYERILVGYGDDSVAELGGAHVACENVSNVLTKLMQDSRIGVSPLEKSTRYIYFDQKEGGKYRYLREKKIMQSRFADEYESVCDLLFDTYSRIIPLLSKVEEEKFPIEEGLSERAYSSTIRAKVCDLLRGILPASTLTNSGFFGNGRAFEYMLVKMYAHPLSEARIVAAELHSELRKVIPSFVKRADEKYGKEMQDYLSSNLTSTRQHAMRSHPFLSEAKEEGYGLSLIEYDERAEEKVLASILFPHLHCSMQECKEAVAKMSPEEKANILNVYVGQRGNRRQKPGRAFECADYTFCVIGNFGMYRDLHRHRILTQERQLLTTRHGFDMPCELSEAGFEGEIKEAIGAADALFCKMEESMPFEAQYVVPLGCRMRWYMKMNLREAYHFSELRSMRQGHIDYRRVAQDVHKLISNVHPRLALGMKFVDFGNYEFERLEAEKKIDKKLNELGKK